MSNTVNTTVYDSLGKLRKTFLGIPVSYSWLYLFVGVVVAGFAWRGSSVIVMILIALYALRGVKQSLEAFFIMAVILLGSSVYTSGQADNLRYLIFFSGFFTVFFNKKSRNNKLRGRIVLFCSFLFLTSLFSSRLPLISFLKVLSFLLGTYTLVEGFAQSKHLVEYWNRLLNSFFVFILIGSLLFLVAGLGYERNGAGFQGVLTHPQTFGPVMAVVSVWFIGNWLMNGRKSIKLIFWVLISLYFIYLSQARTAFFALVVGGGLSFILQLGQKQAGYIQSRLVQFSGVFFFIGLFLFVLYPQQIQDRFQQFIQKGQTDVTSVSEVFQGSRGELSARSMDNFREHPFFGIGLGVPSESTQGRVQNIQYLFGIPVSASVEKGFLPTAVLEEIGILGALLTVSLIWAMVARVARRHSFFMLWMLLAALLINAGEAVFFSLGGTGLFVWMVICFTYNLDLLR